MQSGIKASADLRSAFSTFQTSSDLALLVTIASESLQPSTAVPNPASTPFPTSLTALQPHLSPTAALYILLHTPRGLICTTYVPDSAPVRQKMLFASTRLTLVRELGTEHFAQSDLFVTMARELTPEGWRAHEAHEALEQPLTEEERASKELREAEGQELGGTGRREGHYVSSAGEAGGEGGVMHGGPGMKFGEGVHGALEGLGQGRAGEVVQLHIDVPSETILLSGTHSGVQPGALAGQISSQEPRYTFYTLAPHGGQEVKTVFIYTCPPLSRVKDRMVYASSRRVVVALAEKETGLTLDKKLEGAGPEDFGEEVLMGEFEQKKEESKSFARPKRPGRR